jgi:hypothetical protein
LATVRVPMTLARAATVKVTLQKWVAGPVQPRKRIERGYTAANNSPFARLFNGYRRLDPGLDYLVPGNGSTAIKQKAAGWARGFRAGDPEYQTDEKWYAAAKQHDELVEQAKLAGVGGRLSAPAGCAEHTIRRSPGSKPRGYRDYRNRGKGITPTGAGGRSLAVVEFDRPGTATVAAGRCDCSRQSMTLVACKWRRAQFSASAQPPSHPQALTTPGSYCAAVQRRCS